MLDHFLELAKSIDWRAGVGVLFGAAISAIIAYALQRSSFQEARQQREKDRKEVRKALALSLVFKMVRISSDLNNLREPIVQAIERVTKERGTLGTLFQKVLPTVPLPDPVKFTADEMAWLLSVDNKLFNEMGPMDALHSSTVGIFAFYNTKRTELLGRVGAEMKGMLGTIKLTPEQKLWFDPLAAELNQLVEVMVKRVQRDTKETLAALDKLAAAVSKEFDIDLRFEKKPGIL